jgi:ABC-type Na+ transport system ATPase subunit NatA
VIEVVEQLCTWVVILSEGRIVAHDRVDHLRHLQHDASLEHVFVELAVRHDVDKAARALIETVRG